MAFMAQPWKHPTTGAYYLRRQIPEALRPAFGHKTLYKVSLRTKSFAKAAQLFAEANADLERQFEVARARFVATGDSRPSQKDHRDRLVAAYFTGPAADGGLDGAERLALTFLEGDRILHRVMDKDNPMYGPPSDKDRWLALSTNAALFRAERDGLKKGPGERPGKLWKMMANNDAFSPIREFHAKRVIHQIHELYDVSADDLPEGLGKAIIDYLDEAPLEHQTRVRKPRHAATRLRPSMRLGELFGEWKLGLHPSAKCAHEYSRSVEDFIDYTGDIAVSDIVNDDLLNWRDEVAKMPKSMPRADRELRFTERLAKHGAVSSAKVSPTTVKKRVGGIQALLTFAHDQKWIARNEGLRTKIVGYTKGGNSGRRIFQDGELQSLFASKLFTKPIDWRIETIRVSDCALYWLFLIGLTSGARLEEIGQAALADVRLDGKILYIDIDDYVTDAKAAPKSVKNPNSRRVVPIHDHVLALGFVGYVTALRRAGHRELFPDLRPNKFGKRTQGASQRANRHIDTTLSDDGRIMFHCFRHTFKNKGTTARIDSRILDQLCGHTPTTVGGKYGEGQPLWVLHEELHKIDISCIDWTTILSAAAKIDWASIALRLRAGDTSP